MFQYALGKSLAIKNNTDLYLDLSWYESSGSSTQRKFGLDIFNTDFKIANAKLISDTKPLAFKFLNTLLVRLKLGSVQARNYFVEGKIGFNSSFKKIGKVCYINGYWQSYKYFQEYRDLVESDFTLTKKCLSQLNTSYLERIINNNSVSIHVRRSDYTLNHSKSVHGTLSSDYYIDAIRIMQEKINSPCFFVFSDDIDWAKETFKDIDRCSVIRAQYDYLDLYLMSHCKNNIIANSSFSWWGSWLNSNPKKIVIAPYQWFSSEAMNKQTNDLIPETWLRL